MRPSKVQRYKEPGLVQLRAFSECVRRKSFSAAARALNRSHAAVWEQVRALERKLGVSLLERRGHQLQPTEDGQILLEMADPLVAAMDSLEELFAERRCGLRRTLTLVGTHAAIIEELAGPIVQFCQEHPAIQMTILNYVRTPVLDAVSTGEVDLAILPSDLIGVLPRQLIAEELGVRPAVLVTPAGHPLAGKRRLTLADLVRHPLILPSAADSPWRKEVDEVFRRAGLKDQLRVLMEVSFVQASRRYVSQGLGIALAPLPFDAVAFPNICIRPLSDLFPAEQLVILWRRGIQRRPQAQLFTDFVHKWLEMKTKR